MVRSVLRETQELHPEIGYAAVLAYMPEKHAGEYFSDTMLPEGVECVPKCRK